MGKSNNAYSISVGKPLEKYPLER